MGLYGPENSGIIIFRTNFQFLSNVFFWFGDGCFTVHVKWQGVREEESSCQERGRQDCQEGLVKQRIVMDAVLLMCTSTCIGGVAEFAGDGVVHRASIMSNKISTQIPTQSLQKQSIMQLQRDVIRQFLVQHKYST